MREQSEIFEVKHRWNSCIFGGLLLHLELPIRATPRYLPIQVPALQHSFLERCNVESTPVDVPLPPQRRLGRVDLCLAAMALRFPAARATWATTMKASRKMMTPPMSCRVLLSPLRSDTPSSSLDWRLGSEVMAQFAVLRAPSETSGSTDTGPHRRRRRRYRRRDNRIHRSLSMFWDLWTGIGLVGASDGVVAETVAVKVVPLRGT